MSKFVIFAHARSGSTSLAKVLDASPDIRLLLEPFHEDFTKWYPVERDYSSFINSEKTMDQALDEIFTKYDAIKVLIYQFSNEIYTHMLSRKDTKVLFLHRENLLDAAISSKIAEQTDVWQVDDIKDYSQYERLQPLDIDDMRRMIEYLANQVQYYLDFLKENRSDDFIELTYERLFSNDHKKNLKKISEICNFLKIQKPSDEDVRKYMYIDNAKINVRNLYKKVPNYDEIMRQFS